MTRAAPRPRGWVRVAGTIGLVVFLLAASSGVALTLVADQFARGPLIARNVFIEDVPAGGMKVEEAVQALESQWVPKLPSQITLSYPGGSLPVPTSKLGITLQLDKAAADAYRIGREGSLLDRVGSQLRLRQRPARVRVECAIEEAALDGALAGIARKVDHKPRDAQVEVNDKDEVSVTPEVMGVALDLARSKAALLTALTTPNAGTVPLVVNQEKPAIVKADLADLETVLSSYTTHFNSGQEDRTHNLTLAAQAMNHTLVKPGDVFSLNGIVGERSPSRGYRKAPIFGEGGTLIDDYGGGVCQVASTTYNAALLADMAIVERGPHIRTVTYVPLGRDAMVSYGNLDLKWRNSLDHPVLVVTRVEGESLTITLIGKRTDKREVRIERSGVAGIGHGRKEIKDPNLEEGKKQLDKPGWDGGQASVQRLVKVDGKWKCDLSYSDSYPSQSDVVKVGAKKKPKPGVVPAVPGEPTPGTEPPAEGSTPAVGAKTGPAPKPKPGSRHPAGEPPVRPQDFEAP